MWILNPLPVLKHFYLFMILVPAFCMAQEKDSLHKSTLAFSAGAEYGKVLATNIHLKSYEHKDYAAYSFQLLKQTTGTRDWEKQFNYPQYGIGVLALDFLHNRQMGSPFAVYGIYNAKIRQWGPLKWYHHVNFGISFNSSPFDIDKEYYNTSVSSKTNMFISVGTGMYYELGKYFDIGLNVRFNHLSNGGLKIPNKGLNTWAPQLSLVYYPERAALPETRGNKYTPYDKYNTFEVSVFGGRKNAFYRGDHREDLRLYEGYNYSVYGAEAFYMRQYSAKSAYGIGVGVTMDEQYNHQMYVSDSTLYQKKRFSDDRVLLSVIPSYRLMMGKLSVNIGAGYYVFKKQREYDDDAFFQRIGLQYQITDRFFASFGINAYNFHVANYLEWKLGYTFSKKVRK